MVEERRRTERMVRGIEEKMRRLDGCREERAERVERRRRRWDAEEEPYMPAFRAREVVWVESLRFADAMFRGKVGEVGRRLWLMIPRFC